MEKKPEISRLFIIAILLLIATACSGTKKITTTEPEKAMAADGVLSDWIDVPRAVNNDQYALAVTSDSVSLHLMLVFRNRFIVNQIMMAGLTVWIDTSGEQVGMYGVRYPLGMPGLLVQQDSAATERDPEARRQKFVESLGELEIITEPGKGIPMAADGIPGVDVGVSFESESLVYELTIPLQPSEETEYAVGVPADGLFQLGIETGEVDPEALRAAMGGMRGGRGARRGGRQRPPDAGSMGPPQRGRARSGGPGFRPPEPIKDWYLVVVN